ncbi:MAG: TetR/AcrR family transcriptional regulator [Lachnospiraceae bacterium]|nr:TetR/AcrR family transcriptional regulator [Lachnospiraceae bacterium]
MSDPKSTEERRKEIIEAARKLFLSKGYEATSTVDIMNAVGIAKGTLYYHFTSKEEILDALLCEMTDNMAKAAAPYGEDSKLSIPDRIIGVIKAINIEGSKDGRMIETIHLPQNALFHQKSHTLTIEKISPIMIKIVKDGIKQGFFSTKHPESAVHMALSYSLTDMEEAATDPKELATGFVYNLERMLGAREGSLNSLMELFG